MNYSNKDLYKILQLSNDASIEMINNAYSHLARQYHPNSPYADPEKFEEITYAFEILCNPTTRKKYDDSKKLQFSQFMPTIFPVINNSTNDLQGLINLIYENINFHSVNHNPTKSRVYQEIYDEIIKKKTLIESSNADKNPIWKILKTYKSYLSEEEFNGIKLVVLKMMNITEKDANKTLNKTDDTDIPFNKIIVISSIVFIAALSGIILAYVLMPKKTSPLINAPSDSPEVSIHRPEDSNNQDKTFLYFARIVNIGLPVNIRSAPSTEWDNITDKISPGEVVEVIDHKPNGWYSIKKNTVQGYIYGGLLENNDYPDAFAVAQVIPAEIKVFDKDHKLYKILKENDRYVIYYHDNENYYIVSEKGNLILIKKEDVLLENPQKTEIPYIEEKTKKLVKYFAITTEQFIVEDEETNEKNEDMDDKNPEEETKIDTSTLINSKDNKILDRENQYKEKLPPISFPGDHNTRNTISMESYLSNLKSNILSNWQVPIGLDNYSTIVSIRISKSGLLENVRITQSSGSSIIDEASIKAVKLTAPFRPLPDSYNKDSLEIQFNFDNKSQ